MLDTLKWEHLTNKEYYIQTCIFSWPNYSLENLVKDWEIDKSLLDSAECVNRFWRENNTNCKVNFKGDHWYVISDINEKPKYSIWYFDCLGLVVVWEHKYTWENISFITHHDPKFLAFPKNAKQFKSDLSDSLNHMKKFCKNWSIDVVLVGWFIKGEFEEFVEKSLAKYKFSIKLTSDIVKEILWFSPAIVGWPSVGEDWKLDRIIHFKSIFLDTERRRLYLIKGCNNFHVNFVWDWIEKFKEQIKEILFKNN